MTSQTTDYVTALALRDFRIKVMACMETGNHGEARTVLTELEAVRPDLAAALRSDVTASYGITL